MIIETQTYNKPPPVQISSQLLAPTLISYDFVLDKVNLTDVELQLRYQLYGKVFDKEVKPAALGDHGATMAANPAVAGNATATDKKTPQNDFKERYLQFRFLLQELGIVRLKRIFEVRAKAILGDKYPNCRTLDDYLGEYRTGKYDNEKRAMVNTLSNHMWGRECCPMIEQMLMDLLNIKYENFIIDEDKKNKVPPKTRRACGSLRKMLNRLRQTYFADRFR